MIVGILARLPAQCAGQENGRRKYWVPDTLEETGLGKKKIDMKKDRRSTVGVLDRVKTTGLGFFFLLRREFAAWKTLVTRVSKDRLGEYSNI